MATKINEFQQNRLYTADEILAAIQPPTKPKSAERVHLEQEILQQQLRLAEAERQPQPRTWSDVKPAVFGLSTVALIGAATLLAPATGGSSLWLRPLAGLTLSRI